jgi:hypothetical protein
MSKRHGKPGDPPSPNQAVVLGALQRFIQITIRHIDGEAWVEIDQFHFWMSRNEMGGSNAPNTALRYGPTTTYQSWHRSTVRDHLNDLVLKGHVEKRIAVVNNPAGKKVRRAHYRPVTL